jgi:adenine deaminase
VPIWVRQTVRNAPVGRADLRLRATGGPIRVIGVVPEQLLTEHLVLEPTVRDGVLVADPDRDLAKVAVVERHHATGAWASGFVRGFGLRAGAFATTVAHDAHNIVVVGVADDDMALCVARLGRDRRRDRGRRRSADPRRAAAADRGDCCRTGPPRRSWRPWTSCIASSRPSA